MPTISESWFDDTLLQFYHLHIGLFWSFYWWIKTNNFWKLDYLGIKINSSEIRTKLCFHLNAPIHNLNVFNFSAYNNLMYLMFYKTLKNITMFLYMAVTYREWYECAKANVIIFIKQWGNIGAISGIIKRSCY